MTYVSTRSIAARLSLSAASFAAVSALALPSAFAADNACKPAEQQFSETSSLIVQACEAYKKQSGKNINCQKAGEIAADAQNIIKSAASLLGIGPKTFAYDSTYSGTIQSLTKRLWVSATPAPDDEATVQITKTDGKGKVRVNICAAPFGSSAAYPITTVDIEGSKTFKVPNAKDKLISVELIGKEALHKFSYRLVVKD